MLIKQRVARPGQGRSGGYRVIVVYRKRSKAYFVFGYAKSELDNISTEDEQDLESYSVLLLALDDDAIALAIEGGELTEIDYAEET